MNHSKLVRIEALAVDIGIPARTLRSLFHAGKIPGLKLGHRTLMFDPDKVRDALNKFEVKAVC